MPVDMQPTGRPTASDEISDPSTASPAAVGTTPPEAAASEGQPAEPPTVQNIRERGIDVGIVVYGMMDSVDAEAIRRARAMLIAELRQTFPELRWRIPLIRRPELTQPTRVEPVQLLQHGVEERDVHGWDFAVLITASDLVPHYKSRALGVVARLLDLAVISTARLDPFAFDETQSEAGRLDGMTSRLHRLLQHTLGHLCGLSNVDEAENLMFDLESVGQLDLMHELTPEQLDQMRSYLREIDDARLEETRGRTRQPTRFYLQSAWINRHEIVDAVRHARPWEFPRRLSRLTTAAMSSLIVLMLTGESWDLALSQSLPLLVALLAIALVCTTVFVIRRQRLLTRREHRRLTEQVVVSNVSTVLIVAAGMFSMGALLFGISWLTGYVLFNSDVVSRWSSHETEAITWKDYLLMASFVTSLGLFVGALGASFEDHYDIRHITFVDEET